MHALLLWKKIKYCLYSIVPRPKNRLIFGFLSLYTEACIVFLRIQKVLLNKICYPYRVAVDVGNLVSHADLINK